ncbi:MAG: hypothetical protein SNG35_08845 [Rikenellaceae bacterium]
MKKILFTLLIAMGVMVSASAQKLDINAVIAQTVEQAAAEKGYTPEQKKFLTFVLNERTKEGRELQAKKLPKEEHQAASKAIVDKYKAQIDAKIGKGSGNYVFTMLAKNRTAATQK